VSCSIRSGVSRRTTRYLPRESDARAVTEDCRPDIDQHCDRTGQMVRTTTTQASGTMPLIRVGHGFSWWRLRLQLDLCLGVGPVNQKSTGKKWFPKLGPFSGPKKDRTKRAPIMGAQFVLSKMGPEFDPTFRRATQIDSTTMVSTFHRTVPIVFSVGVSRSPDQFPRQRNYQKTTRPVWPGTLSARHTRGQPYPVSTRHLCIGNRCTLDSNDGVNENGFSFLSVVLSSPELRGLALFAAVSSFRTRLLPSRVFFQSSLSVRCVVLFH